MSWTLAIETSTLKGSIAVSSAGTIRSLRTLGTVSNRHAQRLFVEIDAACDAAGISSDQLERIAISIGPGSFTGLRIGVVAAKTLAWSLGCPLYAIDTFLGIAAGAPDEIENLQVIGDAQRGELFVGKYERNRAARNFERAGAIEIVPFERFLESLTSNDVVLGPGIQRYRARLADRVKLLSEEFLEPRADRLCLIAESDLLEPVDPMPLQPLYLRKSYAEEKRDLQNS